MMITKEEVQKFLNQFHEKMKIFGIIYRDDRGKNQKTLEELEIVPSYNRKPCCGGLCTGACSR